MNRIKGLIFVKGVIKRLFAPLIQHFYVVSYTNLCQILLAFSNFLILISAQHRGKRFSLAIVECVGDCSCEFVDSYSYLSILIHVLL